MSSEQDPAKRTRYEIVEARLRERLQETADEIFQSMRRYMWCRLNFGLIDFHVVYCRKLEYDIDPYILEKLVQATHTSLREEYEGSPFDETFVPTFDVFVGLLDKLVDKY